MMSPLSLREAMALMHRHDVEEESDEESDLDIEEIISVEITKAEMFCQENIEPLYTILKQTADTFDNFVTELEEMDPFEQAKTKTVKVEKQISQLKVTQHHQGTELVNAIETLNKQKGERKALIDILKNTFQDLKHQPSVSPYTSTIHQMGARVSGYLAHQHRHGLSHRAYQYDEDKARLVFLKKEIEISQHARLKTILGDTL